MERPNKVITIFGSARLKESDRLYAHAHEVGALIAEEGWGVANGGGPGVMDSSARGAKHNQGYVETYVITLPFEEIPTEFTDETYIYGYFSQRQRDLMNSGNAYIVFPGGTGTAYELFYLLTEIACKKRPKAPVILYDERFWKTIINFDVWAMTGLISEELLDLFVFASTPKETMEILKT